MVEQGPAKTRERVRSANKLMDQMLVSVGRTFGDRPTRQAPQPIPAGAAAPVRYTRDFQRGNVYEAEKRLRRVLDRQHEFPVAEVAGSRIVLPRELKFGDLASAQRYVDSVLARHWLDYPRMQGVRVPVVVKPPNTDQTSADYTGGQIRIPVHAVNPATGTRWAMRELLVLHELAHHAVAVHTVPGTVASHGPEFVRAFRELCVGMMGPELALLFDVIFHEGGVRV